MTHLQAFVPFRYPTTVESRYSVRLAPPLGELLAALGPVALVYRPAAGSECCCSTLARTLGSGAPLRAALAIRAGGVLEELRCTGGDALLRVVRLPQSDFGGWERAVAALGGYDASAEDTPLARADGRSALFAWHATRARVSACGDVATFRIDLATSTLLNATSLVDWTMDAFA